MTYDTGNIILASDLNGFLTSANNIYGVGTGDRGYGQIKFSQAAVKIGDIIRATHWSNLRSMIVTCASHQATGLTVLPPANVYAVGQLVIAYPGTSYEFKADLNAADQATGGISIPSDNTLSLPIYLTAIDNNRLNVAPTALSVASSVWTITRATTWSVSIVAEVSATWPSEDAARAYFNSGGEIRLRGSQSGGGTQGTNWNTTLVNGLGTLKFAVHSTSNTGTLHGSSTLGYFELTNTYQTIFTASTGGSGYYYSASGDKIVIAAKRLNYTGARGGNGAGVQFQITLNDTGSMYQIVNSAGMTFTFDNAKATTFLTGIVSPTYTTIDPF